MPNNFFRAKDKLVNAKFIIQRPLIYKKLFSQEFWRSVTIIIWKQVFYTFTVYCNTLRQSIFPIYLMILLQRVVVKLILLWRSCFTSYWSHKISLEVFSNQKYIFRIEFIRIFQWMSDFFPYQKKSNGQYCPFPHRPFMNLFRSRFYYFKS